MRLRKLPRTFYLRPTLRVAKTLLGKYLVRRAGRSIVAGRIVEVEAYLGERDPASHAFRGKTKRNEVMFRGGGRLYVYFTYGMHFCSNVVTEREGLARAVLLRAVEPVAGVEVMTRNRARSRTSGRRRRSHTPDRNVLTALCSGPAKLCQAFGIGRAQNGADLCGDEIWLAEDPRDKRRVTIAVSARIGVTSGAEHRWRYTLKGSPFLSRT